MKSIFIDCNDQLDQVWAKVIRTDDPKIDVNTAPFKREELPLVLAGYEIALDDHSYMPTELVERCKSLKHIVFLGTGAASYMNIAELKDRGITVHTIKGYGDIAVAEHTMALMLAAGRGVARMDREVRAGVWSPTEGFQFYGKTLGQETRGFLSAERIARLKSGVILVNTARGALVDEAALVAALKSGHIRHAGLDVFHAEPLKPDNALAQLPNVTLTSHAAFRTQEASETLLRRAIDIVKTIVG